MHQEERKYTKISFRHFDEGAEELITQLSCCYLVLREITFIVKTKCAESVSILLFVIIEKKNWENIVKILSQIISKFFEFPT